MSNQKKQWGAIIVMIALFAMIAFVTNLCTPMATIIKNQGEISNVLAQIGNYGNFIAYLVMGIPAGMLIAKFGYKKTALIGLAVGAAGILIQWVSGLLDVEANLGLVFAVYLIGAFIAGLCMCILNCVVNPMLNLLGGGGNSGNQLIQIGGVFNSSAAVACYILMGALISDATKAKIADATPALMIALAIFVVAFIVILFTKIDEPEQVEWNYGNYTHFRSPFSLVVWVDMRTIEGIDERNTEEVKDMILRALKRQSWIKHGGMKFDRIYNRAENVFQGYTLDEVDNQFLMSPYCGWRFTGELWIDGECLNGANYLYVKPEEVQWITDMVSYDVFSDGEWIIK